MRANEAYDAAIDYLAAKNHIVILDRLHDPETFGNFVVGFTEYEVEKSIICDRGEIYLCDGLNGNSNCVLVIPSIYDIDKADLIAALCKVQ